MQNPYSVLRGYLIINFKKVESPKAIQKVNLGADIYDIIIETIESVIAQKHGATLEQINDRLIVMGLEMGFLDILSRKYKDLSPILKGHFKYNDKTQTFHIREDTKFKTNIPIELRIRYFLISYLRRQCLEKNYPTTDEIILHIMPLLQNGITPENQTIVEILNEVADPVEMKEANSKDTEDKDHWELKKNGQQFFL